MSGHHVGEKTDRQREWPDQDHRNEFDERDEGLQDHGHARRKQDQLQVSEGSVAPHPDHVVGDPRDDGQDDGEGDARVQWEHDERCDLQRVPQQDEEEEGGHQREEWQSLGADHGQDHLLADELQPRFDEVLILAGNDLGLTEREPEHQHEHDDDDRQQKKDEVVTPRRLAEPARPDEVLRGRTLEGRGQHARDHGATFSSSLGGSTSSRPSGPANTFISKTSRRTVAGTTARAKALGEKKANRSRRNNRATMTASRTNTPIAETAKRAFTETRAARRTESPLARAFSVTTATPMEADQPVPAPPTAQPTRRATRAAGGPKGTTRRTISHSGSGLLRLIFLAVSQIDQISAEDGTRHHSDGEEYVMRPDQPVEQVADRAPDEHATQHVGADRPPDRYPSPGISGFRSASHRSPRSISMALRARQKAGARLHW